MAGYAGRLHISIVFLYALGLLNLHGVFTTRPDQLVAPAGMKSRLLGRFMQVSHPALIAAVGALFALSFDTVSQVALFSLTARSLSGWGYALVLGVTFMLGMMTTDGMNGLWVARMLARADRRALIVSRAMGLAIAGHTAERELLFGCAAVAIVGLSFLIGLRLAPTPAPVRPPQT